MYKKIVYIFIIVIIAIVLTAYFTFPLITNLGTFYKPESDFFLNAWIYWYSYHSIVTGNIFNITKLFNSPMLYPFPQVLTHSDFFLFPSAFLYLPTYIISKNHILGVNVAIFSSYVLNFLSCYLTLNHLTKNKYSSIIASIVYSFSPNVIHLFGGHLEYMNRFFIPPFFLFLYNFFEKPNFKNIFYLSLLYILLWFCNIELAIFATISTGIAFPIYLFIKYVKKEPILKNVLLIFKYLPVFLLFIPTVIYYFYPYYDYSKKENFVRSKEAAEFYSAKPLDFLLPFPNNKLFGFMSYKMDHSRRIQSGESTFNYAERTLLPGYMVLILLPYFIYKQINSKDTRWHLYFWVFVFDVTLTFGPYLTIFGRKISFIYSYLYDYIPIIQSIRTPTRIQYLYLFFISYFIAVGLTRIFNKLNKKTMLILSGLLVSILMIEYLTGFETQNHKFKILPIPFDLKDKKVLFLPIRKIEEKINDSKYNVYSIENEFISINGHTGSEKDIVGYSEMHDSLIKKPFTNEWFSLLSLLDIDYILVDKSNFELQDKFNYLVVFEDPNWKILDIKLNTEKLVDICDQDLLESVYLNIDFIYDHDRSNLLLRYSGTNPYNCNLRIDNDQRYIRIKYVLENRNKISNKYITLPPYILRGSDFRNTIILESNIIKQPNIINYNLDDNEVPMTTAVQN